MYVLLNKVHIYIQKSLFTLARYVLPPQNIRGFCRDPHQFTEILIINVDENTSVMRGTLDKLLLNATAVSDIKKALPSTPCNNLSTALRDQTSRKDIRHIVESVKVRNSIINIHLPLMIFIRMHSQESQLYNKYLFCSRKSIIYVQIPPFVSAFSKQIQTHKARASPGESSDKKFKKLYYSS